MCVYVFLKGWLKAYAAFCFLRDFFETSDHSQWGRFSNFSNEKVIVVRHNFLFFFCPSFLSKRVNQLQF